MDFDFLSRQEQIPVHDSGEKPAPNDVSEQGRDHGLPNVVAGGQGLGRPKEDREGDEVHVCDYMVCSEADETHHGKPYGDDFGDNFAGGEGKEDGHADKPVA